MAEQASGTHEHTHMWSEQVGHTPADESSDVVSFRGRMLLVVGAADVGGGAASRLSRCRLSSLSLCMSLIGTAAGISREAGLSRDDQSASRRPAAAAASRDWCGE